MKPAQFVLMRFCEFHQAWFHLVVSDKRQEFSLVPEAEPFNFVQALMVQILVVLFQLLCCFGICLKKLFKIL